MTHRPSKYSIQKAESMINAEGRHPAIREYADRFETAHLPEGLPRQVMETCRAQFEALLDLLPDGPALTSALHKLWESKNEAVFLAVRAGKQTQAEPGTATNPTSEQVRVATLGNGLEVV